MTTTLYNFEIRYEVYDEDFDEATNTETAQILTSDLQKALKQVDDELYDLLYGGEMTCRNIKVQYEDNKPAMDIDNEDDVLVLLDKIKAL